MSKVTGKVVQIIGPVVDVVLKVEGSSKIYDSLEVDNNGNNLVLEVQSHIGENMVRTISMDSTDGLSRGVDAVKLLVRLSKCPLEKMYMAGFFNAIEMPLTVSMVTFPKLARMGCPFTVKLKVWRFIHHDRSTFTGIKVIDLIEPYAKGGKIGLFGGAGG